MLCAYYNMRGKDVSMSVSKDDMRVMILAWMDKMIQMKEDWIENSVFKIEGFEVGCGIEMNLDHEIHVNFKMFRLIEEYAGTEGVIVEPAFFTKRTLNNGKESTLYIHKFVYRDWIFFGLEEFIDG